MIYVIVRVCFFASHAPRSLAASKWFCEKNLLWSQSNGTKYCASIAHRQTDVDRFDPFHSHFAEHIRWHAKNGVHKVVTLAISGRHVRQFRIAYEFHLHPRVWRDFLREYCQNKMSFRESVHGWFCSSHCHRGIVCSRNPMYPPAIDPMHRYPPFLY